MGGVIFGVLLAVTGAVLTWAWDGKIPGIDDDVLGIILMLAGVAVVVLSLIVSAQRNKHVTETRYSDNSGAQQQRQVRRDDY